MQLAQPHKSLDGSPGKQRQKISPILPFPVWKINLLANREEKKIKV
jgi:hypothetical protein